MKTKAANFHFLHPKKIGLFLFREVIAPWQQVIYMILLNNDFTLKLSLTEKIGSGSRNGIPDSPHSKLEYIFFSLPESSSNFLDNVLTLVY